MTLTRTLAALAILAIVVPAGSVIADEHEHHDITIGHSDAGQLKAEFHFDEDIVLPWVSGPINGWYGDHPGFAHLEEDEPSEDFYMLEAGADIYFEIVGFETAFQVWDGLSGPYSTAGTQLSLGDEELHKHLDWHINSDDPGFDMANMPFEAQFKLVDLGSTGYNDSPIYTAKFVPEPATAGLLAVGALAVLRRRRA